jgi:ADP-ribose pyrophosphatase YjhB (NUDIX family)
VTDGFRFCPRCSTELEDSGTDSGARCPNCGKTWYHNAAPTAGCVIVRDGKALITKRARDPEKGRFDIPGGFLDPHEDPVSGLIREVDEELSMTITVAISDLVQAVPHRYGDDGDWTLALGFIARDPGGEPEPADDVAEVRWVTAEELDAIDFAWDHDRELVRKALSL